MTRRSRRPEPGRHEARAPLATACPECGSPPRAAYDNRRTAATLGGPVRLTLPVRRGHRRGCGRYRQPYRPAAGGRGALPQHEFGLDVIAPVGALRPARHRSAPEIHAELTRRGVAGCERAVTNPLDRHDELLALARTDPQRLRAATAA